MSTNHEYGYSYVIKEGRLDNVVEIRRWAKLRLAILRVRLRFITWRLDRLERRFQRLVDRINSLLQG
jgi:hypothetical protein